MGNNCCSPSKTRSKKLTPTPEMEFHSKARPNKLTPTPEMEFHSKPCSKKLTPTPEMEFDSIKIPPPPPPPTTTPTVKLYGSATSSLTAYTRFALLYKSVSPQFVASNMETTVQICAGFDSATGDRETLLRFVESRFPQPPLTAVTVIRDDYREKVYDDVTSPVIVRVVVLQHKSVRWHLERIVRWAEDLAKRGGKKAVDPAVGSPRMEIRKFGKSYSQLLELMLEHAQMEERVVFPVLEMADRGLCKGANEEHAKHLPIMNGIKEDIKSIGVLDSGTPVYQEALYNLSARLKSLEGHCKEHFEEEERDLLPLVQATEMSKEQQKKILVQCVNTMQGTHSHLFKVFLEGLLPQEAMLYLDLITDAVTKNQLSPCYL
ncbi:hypothetical protein Pint_05812 [Pistacia integerrima]|uniref:Uncharacterized protein n=1 Tax=Pistacia integerrima TaxID=434235 RepID=A0ACC0Z279_9ROSI|nr:hypothetical protein Pint_05812 [Pistacia integerrima]